MKLTHRLLLPSLVALPLMASAGASSQPLAWQTTWMAAPQATWDEHFPLPLGMPLTLDAGTLRQVVRTSLGGSQLRVVVSNEYGTAPLKLGRLTVSLESGGAAQPLHFAGRDGVTLPPGERLVSDALALATQAGDRLRLDLQLPQPTPLAGFHWDAREKAWLLPAGQAFDSRAFITELQVEAARAPDTVVAIGDSITDGNGATPRRDERWPDHLARRLAPQGVAVLNAGISGNRLLTSGMGDSGLARFERDVLRHPGVRAAIVLLGTNDIGWPRGPFGPAEPLPAVQAMAQGLEQLARQAHRRGVRLVVGTVPPFEDALKGTPLEGHYTPEKEVLRQALNRWIRESTAFDAVVDFDAVLRDPARPTRLRAELDSGDHLHPGDAGYRVMAEAIDLQALLGKAEKVQP